MTDSLGWRAFGRARCALWLLGASVFAALVAGSEPITAQEYRTANVFQYEIAGTAPPGQFGSPSGIAVDGDGLVYVVDRIDHQVRVHEEDGTLVRAWGGFGEADGRFAWPQGIEIGPDGTVYVLDSGNYRIQRFTPEGRHMASWGGLGALAGRFGKSRGYYSIRSGPTAIAVAENGDVFVGDTGNHRVQRFDADGRFIGEWSALYADIPGADVDIRSLAVASDGTVFVLGRHSNNGPWSGTLVHRYWPSGELIGTWPEADVSHRMSRLLATDDQHLLALRSGHLEKRDLDGEIVQRWRLPPSSTMPIPSSSPMAWDGEGNLLIATEESTDRHVIRLSAQGELLGSWGSGPAGPGQIDYPMALAMNSGGELYVGDAWEMQIQHFDARGNFLGRWDRSGDGEDRIRTPSDVAVGPDDRVYVADRSDDRVHVFESDGRPVMAWSHQPSDGSTWSPVGIAVTGEDSVLVWEYRQSVQRFTPSGDHRGTWRSDVVSPADIGPVPRGMMHAGDVYVLDYRCYSRYAVDGERKEFWLVATWSIQRCPGAATHQRIGFPALDLPRLGPGPGLRADRSDVPFSPASIPLGLYSAAPAPDGSVYVSTSSTVQHHAPGGTLLAEWGGYGSDPGGFLMASDLAVMPESTTADPLIDPGTLYVADTENRRIQVFGFDLPGWRVGYYDNPWTVGYPRWITETLSIDLDWGDGAPIAGVPAEDFSVSIERRFELDDARRLDLSADGGVRLWVDGILLVDAYDSDRVERPALHVLGSGEHHIIAHYRDTGGPASLRIALTEGDVVTATPSPTPSPPPSPTTRPTEPPAGRIALPWVGTRNGR